MQYKSLKLYRPVPNIIIPPAGVDKKHICLAIITENHKFLDAFNFMNIKQSQVRSVFVPTTKKPKTMLTPQYKENLLAHKLRPVRGYFGNYSNVIGKNFYLDLSNLINYTSTKYNLNKFNTGRAFMMVNRTIDTLQGVPEEDFERVLLYTVNLDAPIPSNLRRRKIYPIYKALKLELEQSFDKLLLFFYDHSGGRFVLLHDKTKPVKIGRIRAILLKMETIDQEVLDDSENDIVVDDVVEKASGMELTTTKEKEDIKAAVRNYIAADPSAKSLTIDNVDPDELVTKSVIYHVTGDVDKTKTISDNIKKKDPDKKKATTKKVIEKYSGNLISKPKAINSSRDPMVKMAKPESLVDNQVPSHILEKRKKDFSELLKTDLTNVFKPLETEELPLKVKKIDVKMVKSSVSELKQTLKDRYTIILKGPEGKDHKVEIDLPHLTENGTFVINGQPKVLVNQLIAYPIFFYKPGHGRFETSYGTINIHSKQLAKTSYLIAYMSGYKLPIIMILAYKIGFDKTMDMFGIKYEITETKKENAIKLSDGKYILFTTTDPTGQEVAESFRYSLPSLPVGRSDVYNDMFWRDTLIKEIGTRNCIYRIDQVWKFILTPIAVEVLKSKGDPVELPKIIKYICEEVVKGTVDDRNSVDKQRIRTSEVFTHQIQKQVIAAYNEYLSKKLGGDETARLSISTSKAFSDVVNSQNCQQLETVNPLEELSMMTRITPVGIGGIPDKRAFPQKAMNTHYTYYGNIDPLETPDSAMVGIQQHLTVGAAIANSRGLFTVKDHSVVKESEILSVGPAMVPFQNSDDGCRVMMGTGQNKQAIPLIDAEPPAVQTGYESLLTPLLSDNFVKKSPVDGVIISVDEALIIIKDKETGKEIPIAIRSKILKSGAGKNGLSKFKTTVKTGQRIKKGTIVAEGANITDGLISNGINLLSCYMPWKGYNFEDGVVISESAARKFTSIHVEEEKIYLEPDDDVIFISNVGDELEKGGVLLTHSKATYDVESFKHLRTEGGKVSGIEVYVNTEDVPEKLQPIYEQFKQYFIKVNNKYPQGTFREKGEKFDGILIKFIVEQHLKLSKGDKMNNRHGNKGVVALIEKDENMPVTPWGASVEMIYNPLGVINRMNSGQTAEAHVGLIAQKLGQMMVEFSRVRFISVYQKVLNLLDGTKTYEYSKNVIQKLKSLSDKDYNNIKSKVKSRGYIPIIIPPFKDPTRDKILEALDIVGLQPSYKLKLPEYNLTTDPVAVGFVLVQKLEHMSSKKLAARGVGPYVSSTLTPTAGKKKGGGQKFGESDLYGLLAWDCPVVIDEMFGPLASDHPTKNEMIAEITQTGNTTFRQSKTHPEKDLLNNMIIACHLESE